MLQLASETDGPAGQVVQEYARTTCLGQSRKDRPARRNRVRSRGHLERLATDGLQTREVRSFARAGDWIYPESFPCAGRDEGRTFIRVP